MTWAEVCTAWLAAGTRYRRDTEAALRGLFCVYCDDPAQSLDHIVARANGGRDTPDNLAPVCRTCNGQKSAKSLEAWLEQIQADLARVPRKHRQLVNVAEMLGVHHPRLTDAEEAELDAALARVP